MKRIEKRGLFALALTTCLFAVSGTAAAQEPELPEAVMPQDDLVQELKKLFLEVERKLNEIDIQLADAGAGVAPLEEVEDSGLDKLLRDSQSKSEEVIQGIDRILEIAQQMGGSSMGSSPSSQPQQGQSPLDQERDRGPKDRENTPEKPGQKPHGEEDQPPEEPGDDGDPKSPLHSKDQGENQEGDTPPSEAGPAIPPSDDADQWGFLPPRLQETFRNQGRDELPVRYRDWIDAYYRRLNTRPR